MQYGYTKYLFNTLTFGRNTGCRHTRWRTINYLSNQYIKTIRRKLPGIQINHVRTIESHIDKNPHVHILLHFDPPIRTENKRYIDNKLFRLLESKWTHGHAKVEVLKHSDTPEYAIKYIIKYISKQIYNKNTKKTPFKKSGTIQTIWILRGRRLTNYGITYNCLTWSRQMQHIYLQEQIKRLDLHKNLSQDLQTYHPRAVHKKRPELSEKDQKLLLKYPANNTNHDIQSRI